MNEKMNNKLLKDLYQAHACFGNIIKEMGNKNIVYPYDDVIKMEEKSYHISYNAISRMNKSLQEYAFCIQKNKDYFNGEKKIYYKYLMLYIVSIIMIKVFAKTLSSVKINEIWYALVGLVIGTANANIINKNINVYRYGNKENRELNNNISALKEDYYNDYEIANREISYMFSLNRVLLQELMPYKVIIKK